MRAYVCVHMTDFNLESHLQNEPELVGQMFDALAEGALPEDAWTTLEDAARDLDRLTEVAAAIDGVAHDRKRLGAGGKAVAAEFLYRAARFAQNALGDEAAAEGYLERALREDPNHEPARVAVIERLEAGHVLGKKLETALIDAFRKDSGEPNAALYRRLSVVLGANPTTQKYAISLLEDCQRRAPSEENARALADLYLQAGRLPELARTLEQLLAGLPEEDLAGKNALREELLSLYTSQLNSPERALPYAEALLEQNSSHELARELCTRLLPNKGVQARAALALANASAGFAFEEVRYLELALETTRGPGRRDVLKRLGVLREDPISDLRGAFEAFEGALLLDPTDDEVRSKYREIALSLSNPLDAARTLIRVAPSVKDPAARARIAVDTGELLDVAGDKKRAKTTLASALTAPGALPETQLRAARALASIHEGEGDTKSLLEMLDRLAELETDDERRHAALARMGEMAMDAADHDKAIGAYVRLVDVPRYRAQVLTQLEGLYEAAERWRELAEVIAGRAKDTTDAGLRRTLLYRNAELLGSRVQDARAAQEAWETLLGEFGPSRDIFAEYIPILENLRDNERLDAILVQDIELAPASEHAMLYGRLAAFRIRKVRDQQNGLTALERALALDPSDLQARQLAESLLTDTSARCAVSLMLAPIYRDENEAAALLKVLEILGTDAEDASARLDAWTEAAQLARDAGLNKAIDHAARAALAAEGKPLASRTQLLAQILDEQNVSAARRADAWALGLGEREVTTDEGFVVVLYAGEALEAAGRNERAAEVYRRGLRYAPDDRDLLTRIDRLLLTLGKPEERLAVYEESLGKAQDPGQRHAIYVQIAQVHANDLGNPERALAAYESALELEPSDEDALFAALGLYRKLGRLDDLVTAVDTYLPAAKPSVRPTLALEAVRALGELDQREEAAERGRRLVEDAEVSVPELDKLLRLAEAWQDEPLIARALWKKSEKVGAEDERAAVLLRVASLEREGAARRRALEGAIAAADLAGDEAQLRVALAAMADLLEQAGAELEPGYGEDYVIRLADLAANAGDWREVARRLDALVVRTAPSDMRRVWVMRLARTHVEQLQDAHSAYRVLAREIEGGEHDAELLEAASQLAARTENESALAEAIDQQLEGMAEETWSPTLTNAAFALGLTKARTFAKNDRLFARAAAAYEALLAQSAPSDEWAASPQVDALDELHAFVQAALARGIDARAERRRVQRRRVDRAEGDERALILGEWANEEAAHDPAFALTVYEELLLQNPDDVGAHAAVAKLASEAGDLDKAVHALEEQRQRAEGDRRLRLDLELAELHFTRRGDRARALEHVREVLLVTPSDTEAFALLARIAEDPESRGDVAAVVDQVVDRAIELSDVQGAADMLRWALAHVASDAGVVARSLDKLASALAELGLEQEELDARVMLAANRKDSDSWDRAEELARKVHAPEGLARAYEGIDYTTLSDDDAARIGERAVAFFEEWYEDPKVLLPLLDRLFAVPATSTLAFERLRLYYDTNERWDDLFKLYDRAIARANEDERVQLLEEGAHVAKDFAKNEAKAAMYFEALLEVRKSASTEAALERLYERLGESEKLVALLSNRASGLEGGARNKNDRRIARLRVEALGDAKSALPVLEELASSSEKLDDELTELFEQVLQRAGDDRVTRQRAAQRLSAHYRLVGDAPALARTLREDLSVERDGVRRHDLLAEIAQTELVAGRPDAALEARADVLRLDPNDDEALTTLSELARVERLVPRAVELLAELAEGQSRQRRGALRLHAAREARRLHALQRQAIDLYRAVFDDKKQPKPSRIESATELEVLYEESNQPQERLDVLERHATLEEDASERARILWETGEQARAIGERPRAVAAFESRLGIEPAHLSTLDRLVELYDATGAHADLARVLEQRALAEDAAPADRTRDREHAARLHDEHLGNQPKAIELLEAVVRADGDSMPVAFALASLHGKLGDWAARRDALLRAAEMAPAGEATAQVLGELGELERTRLADVPRALASFARALEQDPRAMVAASGLSTLLGDPNVRAEAGALLDAAYRKNDDVAGILSVVEVRIEAAADADAVVGLLREAATLEERRRDDSDASYNYLARAFALRPHDAELRAELRRLAASADRYPALREVYERVLGEDDELELEVHLELARMLEAPLADGGAALARFRLVLERDDTTREAALAVLRLGIPLEQYKLVANVLATFAEREGVLASDALSATETFLGEHEGAPQRLSEALEKVAIKKPACAKVLAAQAARWVSVYGRDDARASDLFRIALEHDGEDESLLRELVEVERRTADERLVDSLLGLSRVRGGDLQLLTEASEHALYKLQNAKLARSTLGLLRSLSIGLWTSKTNDLTAKGVARYAREKLEELFVREQLPEDRIALLVQDAAEPWDDAEKRELLLRAAELAEHELHDLQRAAGLYQTLFERDGYDREVRDRLRTTLTKIGDTERLRTFSYAELEVLDDSGERAQVRMRIADLEDDATRAEGVLRAALEERPRDDSLVDALAARLDEQKRFDDLFALYIGQAERGMMTGADGETTLRTRADSLFPRNRVKLKPEDAAYASGYFLRASRVAEERMNDPRRALASAESAVRAFADARGMSEATRLATLLDRHAVAAHYLGRMLEREPKVETFIELADVHTRDRNPELTERVLERGLEANPESNELRRRLATHYRERQNWSKLAPLLEEVIARATTDAERIRVSLESARIYTQILGAPDRAIALLESARQLDPEDRSLRLAMADALGEGGRTDEARALLETELESYGGRRPKERAPVHLHLARLYRLGGDETRALAELDTATKIDPTYQPAVRMLGELAERNGQWEKAERAYRALLSVVRRADVSQDDNLSSAEVLLLLSRVATAKGEEVRGSEILETAFEAAHDAPAEAARLEARLRTLGDTKNLARVLRMRATQHDADADTLRELAKIELEVLGEPNRAYESARTAFRREPGRRAGDLLLEIAHHLGKEGELEREFAEAAEQLSDEGKLAHAARHASLLALLHRRHGNTDEAIRWIEKNRDASELTADDAELLAEMREARGELDLQVVALELLLEQAKDATRVRDTKLRLARLLYSREATVEDGSRYLIEAREEGASLDELVALVGDAVDDFPANAHLVEIYVQFARELGSPSRLARALVRAWAIAKTELSFLDEAVEAARQSGDPSLEESVLRDVVESADPEGEPAALLFGLVELAGLRERQGDVSGVIGMLSRAAELASDELEREVLKKRLAEYARDNGENIIAAEAYASLFDANRDDQESLTALKDLYRATKQGERLAELLADLALAAEDPSERLRLQFERLRVLEDDVGLPDAELVRPLRDIVLEAPDEAEAAGRLVAILERIGPKEELASVLDFLFEAALDRGIHEALAERALRLAALHEENREPERAIATFESALRTLPQDPTLLRAFADALRKYGPKERLEGVLDELATQDDPKTGAQLSIELADLALERGDLSASTAALERAVRLDPHNMNAVTQLEACYRDSNNTAKLAAFLAQSAASRPTPRERSAVYQRAAELYQNELRTPARAAELFALAEAETPGNETLVFETARAQLAVGDRDGAARLLRDRADAADVRADAKARYLAELAEILAAVDPVYAARTREEAARLARSGPIAEGYLDFVQGLLDGRGDARPLTSEQRTELTFNLARAHADRGELARARELVDTELTGDPENVPGLLTLAEFEERDGRLEEALGTYFRALTLQRGEFSMELPLRVAALAEQLGRPEEARIALERIRLSVPDDRESRVRLEAIYESAGMFRQLAEICQELGAIEQDPNMRFGYLLKAGNAYLESGEDLELSIEPLTEAHALRPQDLDAVALLSDANTSIGRIDDAAEVLMTALAAMKNRRSREIGTLYHRVARVAQARGDRQGEMSALTTALEMDPQNGIAALELSQIAIELGDLELAARALRALTMMRGDGPIPRALAYKQLGEIAWAQGDQKKAVIMLKRALDDDPQLGEARALLAQIDR